MWSVTSGAGLPPISAFGYYCASKFGTPEDFSQKLDGDLSFSAHEGTVSTLAAEIDPKWNIQVGCLPAVTITPSLTLRHRSLFSSMVPSARGPHPQNQWSTRHLTQHTPIRPHRRHRATSMSTITLVIQTRQSACSSHLLETSYRSQPSSPTPARSRHHPQAFWPMEEEH